VIDPAHSPISLRDLQFGPGLIGDAVRFAYLIKEAEFGRDRLILRPGRKRRESNPVMTAKRNGDATAPRSETARWRMETRNSSRVTRDFRSSICFLQLRQIRFVTASRPGA